jgi:spermidine/putrescine transport system ATP-binding protein
VYRRPANRFVAEFLGSANIFDAVVTDARAQCVALAGGVRMQVSELPAHVSEAARVVVCIRPEAIQLRAAESSTGDAVNVVTGQLRDVKFAGAVVECRVAAGALEFDVHLPNRAALGALENGADVTLHIPAADVVVLPAESA